MGNRPKTAQDPGNKANWYKAGARFGQKRSKEIGEGVMSAAKLVDTPPGNTPTDNTPPDNTPRGNTPPGNTPTVNTPTGCPTPPPTPLTSAQSDLVSGQMRKISIS